MSISSAMDTGVSGLLANSTAIGRISENIANANTTGYKRRFDQMVTTTSSATAPSGVAAVEDSTVAVGGALTSTSSATDLAITGNGFFVVSTSPNDPVQSHYLLTRAGSFTPDADGNLVNAAGYYLAGYAYGDSGSLTQVDRNSFSGMQTVNVTSATIAPSATTAIGIQGNLPSQESGVATPGSPFTSSTEYYDALGNTGRILLSWQPTSTPNEWTVSMSDDTGADYGSVTMDFSDSGSTAGLPSAYSNATSTAASPSGFAFDTATGTATLTIANGATPQTIQVALGTPGQSDGMTQFSGDFTPQTFGKDGSAAGKLSSVEIDSSGNLVGVFDNGTRKSLYQIPLGQVTNPNGLTAVDGNAYRLSTSAGTYSNSPMGSGGTGTISGNTLESSNVDIAEELSDLIRIQRAYSTNAKIITTMDDMLQETTQLKR
ncbi:flagellar hook protein FlgE [Acidimangrovimonas sediminis]|uniref:flagellar hook protein FlgE n=1 Tax=Acidimangrovimonas sediminis TaxID=2056283 RepID=UPI000C7FB01E|nr:flagellar hook-basal body complex protein [Acidimangrovimonas sediminis]